MGRPKEKPMSTTAAADLRRDQMLEAAAALIAERGFSDTRITDVARRVGASSALVVYYFGTKDKLLTEALRWSEVSFYESVEEMLEATPSLRARLETLVRMTCVPEREGEVPSAWGLWFDLWAQAFRHPQVSKDREDLDNRWRDIIARVVSEGVAAKEITKVDAQAFAVAWSALLDGLSIQVALEDPQVDPERAFRIAMDYATQALGLPKGRSRSRRP
jgi:AcrR family transcriptional regulator